MKQPKNLCSIECPHCYNRIQVMRVEEIITPAVPAEKEVKYIANKDYHTTFKTEE